MDKYIDIVLTLDGMFCVAPPWVVKEGDLVCLLDILTNEPKMREVISVSTDSVDGEHIKQIEKYVGHKLPKIAAKYMKSEVKWDAELYE